MIPQPVTHQASVAASSSAISAASSVSSSAIISRRSAQLPMTLSSRAHSASCELGPAAWHTGCSSRSFERPMKTPTEMLEEELAFFAAELEPDLDRLRDLAPRFVSLFTETVLNTLVLQHALRKKGLLTGDDLIDATRDAQEAMKRVRARGMMSSAGCA